MPWLREGDRHRAPGARRSDQPQAGGSDQEATRAHGFAGGSVRSFVFEVGFLLLFWSGFLKARERLQVPPKPRGYGGAQPPFQSRQALFLNLPPNWIAN